MKTALSKINTPHVIIVCVMTLMLMTTTIPVTKTNSSLLSFKGEVHMGGMAR